MGARARLQRRVARWLEEGTLAPVWPDALAELHGRLAARGLARPLLVPPQLHIVTVGGATLGGSGKTRVAIAATRVLAEAGAHVALVGHAYRARPVRPRIVQGDEALAAVGDEALGSAAALSSFGDRARVVVAPTRQAALGFVAALSPRVEVVVLDGPLQLTPTRASLALLAVDAAAPWGAGALPPAGDLRAPRAALLAAADLVVPVDALPSAAWVDGERVALAALPALGRLGLFTALARPSRLLDSLRQTGLVLPVVVSVPDHGPADRNDLARAPVDLWLATEKCARHLLHLDGLVPRAAIAFLEGHCELPLAARTALLSLLTPPHIGPA